MGSTYFGQAAFGELPAGLSRTIQAVPASATASAPVPSVGGSSVVTAPVARATASAPVPSVKITVAPPSARATASFPVPFQHGTTTLADMPTALPLKERITALEIGRETSLEVERETVLALHRLAAALDLFDHQTSLALMEQNALTLHARTTTLYLDPGDTTLVPDDRVKELALDG